ncbi:DUF2726 domain-containing protein [Luteolibacter algae]|uniref:DUF2726 domain-containing protein n=1 Tax=Luteolibacter algae TaxID=454151 RepID=A0ABW5D6Q1_9BACT
MTTEEIAFFEVLKPLAPEGTQFLVHPRLDEIFGSGYTNTDSKNGRTTSARVDFALMGLRSKRILCGVELDDQSHFTSERMERDRAINAVFAANRTTLLRIPQAQTYNRSVLHSKLQQICQINLSPAA